MVPHVKFGISFCSPTSLPRSPTYKIFSNSRAMPWHSPSGRTNRRDKSGGDLILKSPRPCSAFSAPKLYSRRPPVTATPDRRRPCKRLPARRRFRPPLALGSHPPKEPHPPLRLNPFHGHARLRDRFNLNRTCKRRPRQQRLSPRPSPLLREQRRPGAWRPTPLTPPCKLSFRSPNSRRNAGRFALHLTPWSSEHAAPREAAPRAEAETRRRAVAPSEARTALAIKSSNDLADALLALLLTAAANSIVAIACWSTPSPPRPLGVSTTSLSSRALADGLAPLQLGPNRYASPRARGPRRRPSSRRLSLTRPRRARGWALILIVISSNVQDIARCSVSNRYVAYSEAAPMPRSSRSEPRLPPLRLLRRDALPDIVPAARLGPLGDSAQR